MSSIPSKCYEVNVNDYKPNLTLTVGQNTTAHSCDEDSMNLITIPEIYEAFHAITTIALTPRIKPSFPVNNHNSEAFPRQPKTSQIWR